MVQVHDRVDDRVDMSPAASVMVRHAQRDGHVPKTEGTEVLVGTRLRGTAGQGKDSQWRSPVSSQF